MACQAGPRVSLSSLHSESETRARESVVAGDGSRLAPIIDAARTGRDGLSPWHANASSP